MNTKDIVMQLNDTALLQNELSKEFPCDKISKWQGLQPNSNCCKRFLEKNDNKYI